MNDDPVRDALRRWDPATNQELSSGDRMRIRRAVTNGGRVAIMPLARIAAAVAIVAFAGLAGIAIRNSVSPSQPLYRSATPVPDDAGGAEQKLQIHYSTPGGTRIVWTMDPSFSL